jgi:hypothetical protein
MRTQFKTEIIVNKITNCILFNPGANPTIVIYIASVVKIYKPTNSITRFLNENLFPYFKSSLSYVVTEKFRSR